MNQGINKIEMENEPFVIEQAKVGDQAAFNTLFSAYRGYLQRYLLSRHHDWDAVEDIIQETFLKVFRAIQTYHGNGSFKGWLRAIACNTWKNYLRDQQLDRYAYYDDVNDLPLPHENSTEENIEAYQEREMLQQAIVQLPEKQRQTVELRVNEQLRFHEIANYMQCSLSTAKANHYFGIKNLQAHMEAA